MKAASSMTQTDPSITDTPISQARNNSSVFSVVVEPLVYVNKYKVWFKKEDLRLAKNSILLSLLKTEKHR